MMGEFKESMMKAKKVKSIRFKIEQLKRERESIRASALDTRLSGEEQNRIEKLERDITELVRDYVSLQKAA